MKQRFYILLIASCFTISQLQCKDSQHSQQNIIFTMSQQFNLVQKKDEIPASQDSNIKSIIFDINGVLCQTDELQAAYLTGYVIANLLAHLQIPSKDMLFSTLADVPAISTQQAYTKGRAMPQIMVDWKIGAQKQSDIQHAITDYLKTAPFPQAQKDWVQATADMMIDPEKFVQIRKTIPANIDLLHELKEKGYKLYIVSNWEPSSFPLFQEKFPQVFTYKNKSIFDGIVTSGQVGIVKPQPGIFHVCLNRYSNIKPEKTIFIDDEPANIQTAQKIGMHTILANPADAPAVRTNLITLLKNN